MSEQILVRNLANGTKARLKEIADKHGRSIESEVREIITTAITGDASVSPMDNWLAFAERFRGEFGGVDLESPSYDDYGPKAAFE